MKRTLTSIAATGLMALSLAACGGDTDEDAPEDTPPSAEETEPAEGTEEVTEPESEPTTEDAATAESPTSDEPTEPEATSEPADPAESTEAGEGEDTGAAADPDLEEFCSLANAPFDPEAPVNEFLGTLEAMRAVAPPEVAPHLDAFIGELEKATPEEMEGVDLPASVDLQVVSDASTGLAEEGAAACSGQ